MLADDLTGDADDSPAKIDDRKENKYSVGGENVTKYQCSDSEHQRRYTHC